MKYFRSSFAFTFISIVLAFFVGHHFSGTWAGAWSAVFVCVILGILEVSISFDNAVVNATVLKKMTPLWQQRFLTWGMVIAVFGMRLVFPLIIVALAAQIGPVDALMLAILKPDDYAKMMASVHHEVAAFGGAFLMLVALKYFFDQEKEIHWIGTIERVLSKLGRLEAAEVAFCLLLIVGFSKFIGPEEQLAFIVSGVFGVVTYVSVEAIGTFLKVPDGKGPVDLAKASFGMFLYLEVLDASFSFDGVIGAFAITNNLFLIVLGLGIGAMFVRSLTIYMVEKSTLSAFKYLEHGAFWAVGCLALMMFLGVVFHVPEWLTGVSGALIIGGSLVSSILEAKSERLAGKSAQALSGH